MRVLDLFSGIGGFSLGLERAGMETVAFCEIEEYPRKVLKKHWPDVTIYEDVRTLTKEKLIEGGIDDIGLICGGYPCQPFSLAGKQRGEEDDRHLWPEMYRLIKTIRPRWVIAENVAGHITMGLDTVLSDLEAENYVWWTFVIPACAVDAGHRRDRVWVVANTSELRGWEEQVTRAERKDSTQPGDDGQAKPLAHAYTQGLSQSTCAGLQCFQRETEPQQGREPCGGNAETWRSWPAEPNVGRVANGIPFRVDRLKGLGNAVVPQIPEIIGRAIMEIESESPELLEEQNND